MLIPLGTDAPLYHFPYATIGLERRVVESGRKSASRGQGNATTGDSGRGSVFSFHPQLPHVPSRLENRRVRTLAAAPDDARCGP